MYLSDEYSSFTDPFSVLMHIYLQGTDVPHPHSHLSHTKKQTCKAGLSGAVGGATTWTMFVVEVVEEVGLADPQTSRAYRVISSGGGGARAKTQIVTRIPKLHINSQSLQPLCPQTSTHSDRDAGLTVASYGNGGHKTLNIQILSGRLTSRPVIGELGVFTSCHREPREMPGTAPSKAKELKTGGVLHTNSVHDVRKVGVLQYCPSAYCMQLHPSAAAGIHNSFFLYVFKRVQKTTPQRMHPGTKTVSTVAVDDVSGSPAMDGNQWGIEGRNTGISWHD
ncbi:hypothetical protein ARMGADRAFT_1066546 [Armillaria gallica]|uniref:Uncharacterized protein n=1 Tax=Armillaria gallica TaxID=47427 RepID=A0A2H3CUD8_ARMGA|nr:hypothetical protein ARMGADRAFT_1066546 [Armillaria gallica]